MIASFPLNAKEIDVKCQVDGGGLGFTATTDTFRLPYIGIYPLDAVGQPSGQPIRFQRECLMARIVVQFINGQAIVAFIDALVSARGLDVRISWPPQVAHLNYPKHLYVHF